MTEIYRKQASRLEQLEKENRRLQTELDEEEAKRRKIEDEVEELREAKGELAMLREQAQRAGGLEGTLEKLVRRTDRSRDACILFLTRFMQRGEIASLQRQNAHLQQQSSKSSRRVSTSGAPPSGLSPAPALEEVLQSKSTTIESMEVEISNLRAQLSERSSSSTAHDEQVAALEKKLERSESAAESFRREQNDLKKSLERASERAVKEGGQRSSAETRIRGLEDELTGTANSNVELGRKSEGLEKKVSTLTTLLKEADVRTQGLQADVERNEQQAAELQKRLTAIEKASAKLQREQGARGKSGEGAVGDDDDDGLDELEDEERQKLQARIRELEGEVFELKRGMWRQKRRDMDGVEHSDDNGSETGPGNNKSNNNFDEVDLTGGAGTSGGFSPRRTLLGGGNARGQKSFTGMLSGGLSALTGGGGAGYAPAGAGRARGDPVDETYDDTDDFDEEAFRRAYEGTAAAAPNREPDHAAAELAARRRVERVRETKRNLARWEGWRLDLVESRAVGGGWGSGEIFEI